ncbi:MAG: TetR family transcriptional regulator [candidate division Zixibacteria bacterium]|nr:TetR family transcriptional regulator [candidate division Zixibacteria bacterium]
MEADLKNRIITTAKSKFFRYGFSKISVDELASDLGISKKTLYQHFPSKEALLKAVIEHHRNDIKGAVDRIFDNPDIDSISKLRSIFKEVGFRLSQVGRPFIMDLKKHAPHIWEDIDRFRREQILNRVKQLFEEAVNEGLARRDVNPELVYIIYSNAVQSILNPETISQIPFVVSEIFESLIKILMQGVLTEKARADFSA